jgi:hypothetical protein
VHHSVEIFVARIDCAFNAIIDHGLLGRHATKSHVATLDPVAEKAIVAIGIDRLKSTTHLCADVLSA